MSESSELDFDNFTEEESVNYSTKIIDKLKRSKQSMDFSSIEDEMCQLSSIYFDLEDHLDKICQHFLDKDLINILYYFLWMFSSSKDMSDETLKRIYVILINYSDCSQKFAKAISSSEIMGFLINNCLSDQTMDTIENPLTNELVVKSLKIIHNVVRSSENQIGFRLKEFKLRLMKFVKINDKSDLATMSLLILSYIVEEDEVSMLDDGSDIVQRLLDRVVTANASPSKLCYGFSVAELMHGIRCISFNEKMKLKIDELNGVRLFLNILQEKNEDSVEPILGTLWNLSFVPEIGKKLVNEYQIEKVLEPFKNHTNDKIRLNYEGIMWDSKNKFEFLTKKRFEKKSDVGGSKFDVFISYSWANKEQVVMIRNWLADYNIRVWLDDEQIIGSLLESIANGIENSQLFMISISSSYMKSSNCRSEAEYAHHIRKPIIPVIMELKYKPKSWLGLIMGSKVYFEFSERRNPQEVLVGLLKTIKVNLGDNEVVEKIGLKECESISTKTNAIDFDKPSSTISEFRFSEDVRVWTKEQVKKWLEQVHLDGLKKRFVDVDGSLLAVIFNIRLRSPEYFNKAMKNEFGMKFVDVVKFHKALDDLIQIG